MFAINSSIKIFLCIKSEKCDKERAFTINVLGLALGLSCCMLLIFYIQHQLSYDKTRNMQMTSTWLALLVGLEMEKKSLPLTSLRLMLLL
jgi:extradiol dioxygenase family protein